jgi:hypothetical protein
MSAPRRAALATASAVLGRVFLPEPAFSPSPAQCETYDRIIARALTEAPGAAVDYDCPYPRYDFLRHLAASGQFLFRGMPAPPLASLSPSANTDAHGKDVQAVFATADPLWALFFGTLEIRGRGPVSMRNAGWVAGRGEHFRRFYYFSLNESLYDQRPWSAGTIYILARDGFRPVSKRWFRFDEWLHDGEVIPLATLAIAPEDFPFASKVTRNHLREPMWRTMLQYRWRLRR